MPGPAFVAGAELCQVKWRGDEVRGIQAGFLLFVKSLAMACWAGARRRKGKGEMRGKD